MICLLGASKVKKYHSAPSDIPEDMQCLDSIEDEQIQQGKGDMHETRGACGEWPILPLLDASTQLYLPYFFALAMRESYASVCILEHS